MASATLRAQIAQANAQISQQKALLVELEKKRDVLEAELRRISTFQILTLPPEITSEIFVHCLPWGAKWFRAHTLPRLLLHVCKTWAHIARSTPALWQTWNLDVDVWEHQPHKLLLLMQSWPRLSPSTPLKSTLHGSLAPFDVDAFMAAYAPFLPTISELTLKLDAASYALLNPFKLEMHELRRLEITGWPALRLEATGVFPDTLFAVVPQLRSVVLRSVPHTALSLPWQQITHLRCDNYAGAHIIQVLRSIPGLVRLDASRVVDSGDLGQQLEDCVHSTLQQLRLRDPGGSLLTHVLGSLTLPHIETLDVDAVYEQTLLNFFSRSLTKPVLNGITELHVSADRWLVHDRSIYTHLKQVVTLRIRYPSYLVADSFFTDLELEQTFLPRLQDFTIKYRDGDTSQSDSAEVIRMTLGAIEGRNEEARVSQGRIEPIRHVTLYLTTWERAPEITFTSPEDVVNLARNLRRDGVEVYVGSSTKAFV